VDTPCEDARAPSLEDVVPCSGDVAEGDGGNHDFLVLVVHEGLDVPFGDDGEDEAGVYRLLEMALVAFCGKTVALWQQNLQLLISIFRLIFVGRSSHPVYP